jgi:hypothetical protein
MTRNNSRSMSRNNSNSSRYDRYAVPTSAYREAEWNHLQGGQDRPRLVRQPSAARQVQNPPTIMEERSNRRGSSVYEMLGDVPRRTNEPRDQRPWL